MFEREENQAGITRMVQVDSGLRSHMLKVYNYMTMGLLITAFTSLFFLSSGLVKHFYSLNKEGLYGPNALFWLVVLSPLVLVFMFSSSVNKLNVGKAKTIFLAFSVLMGMSLSTILIAYTGASVFRVFLIAAGTFGGMSLYGYTTKKDLSGWGSFLIMGVIGLIIASVVNMFLGSSMMYMAISVIGVLLFVGLTAYDTQKIRNMYSANDSKELADAKAISGALSLYLDAINLFIYLLRLFGERR